MNIVRQVIEIVKTNASRVRIRDPIEFCIVRIGLVILVDEIDQTAANTCDRRDIHRLSRTVIRDGPFANCMIKRVLRIHDAPAHRWGAGAVFFYKCAR